MSAPRSVPVLPVRLRPVAECDLAALAALNEPEAASYNWAGFRSPVGMRQRYERDGFLGATDGLLVVVDADTGAEALGTVSWRANDWGAPPYSRAWNIGATIRPEHRGRGIGTAAQRLLCDYLFATTTIHRLDAVTDIANIPEQRALVGAGFTREGILREAGFRAGGWHDMVLYSRLRQEWKLP